MKTDFLGRIRTRAELRRVECWLDHRRGLFSQNDLDLANQAGASFRSDNNSALQALGTLSSGATAPATTYAHQLWADTTSGTLKKRNAANSAWIIVRTIDEAFVVDRSSNTILDESDIGKTFRATASFTQTLTAAATLADGWYVDYRVELGAVITFDPNSSENIDGATTRVVRGPASGRIFCNGSAFYTTGFVADGIPQNSQSAAYTTTMADRNGHILHPTADNNPRTFTIDSNANVAYPVGTAITFVNQINTVTIAITSDTLTLAGTGGTGSRTLAANGIATALKIASTSWVISGTGLT